jgi:hypothetical protein
MGLLVKVWRALIKVPDIAPLPSRAEGCLRVVPALCESSIASQLSCLPARTFFSLLREANIHQKTTSSPSRHVAQQLKNCRMRNCASPSGQQQQQLFQVSPVMWLRHRRQPLWETGSAVRKYSRIYLANPRRGFLAHPNRNLDPMHVVYGLLGTMQVAWPLEGFAKNDPSLVQRAIVSVRCQQEPGAPSGV